MPSNKFSVIPHISQAEDIQWMNEALQQARQAAHAGEVPIGAVVVIDNKPVATAHNSPISDNNACAHAELLAIQKACKAVGNYRLGPQATLYVTLQPCMMCLGAILHARIGKVVVGCSESRYNSDLKSALDAFSQSGAWHGCRFETGCMAAESQELLSGFFKGRRRQREQAVSELASLMHLPNANKEAVAELASLGYDQPAALIRNGLDATALQLRDHAEMLKCNHRLQQAAIFQSLADYFSGEAVQSWKNYLQG